MSLFKVFDVAGSAMHAQTVRLNTVSSNLANADSVGSTEAQAYRSRHPVFAAIYDDASEGVAGVEVQSVEQNPSPARREYRPEHPLADADGYVFSPNVNPVNEMADMISASRAYEANLELISASRQLLQRTLSLGE